MADVSPHDAHRDDYSNTVDLYDAVPKYFASKKAHGSPSGKMGNF